MRCFHCGDEIPPGMDLHAEIDGARRAVCCMGCRAAAEFIATAGCSSFYDQRTPAGAAVLRPDASTQVPYNDPEVAAPFISRTTEGLAQTTVYIGNLYCAACIWLASELLERLPSVADVRANAASRRVTILWDDSASGLGDVLARLSAVGFAAEPVVPGTGTTAEQRDYRSALKRLAVAALFGMQTMMLAAALYAGEFHGMSTATVRLLHLASLVLTLPILAYSAVPFFRGAMQGLRARRPGMDVPVSLALAIAFAASAWATVTGSGAVYFDSIAMFVALLCLSRLLEMRAHHRADDHTEALAGLLPAAVSRRADDGTLRTVARSQVQADDQLVLAPGDTLAADGTLARGRIEVDESLLTGEANPIVKRPGASLTAGARVVAGHGEMTVSTVGAATALGEVANLVEQARARREGVRGPADRLATVFVCGVIALAATAALLWAQIDPDRVLPISLAILIVACPCAFALATPTALAAAARRLTHLGILLIDSRLLELLRPGAVLVCDKTGTLTQGRPVLSTTRMLDEHWTENRARAVAAALERDSGHALARAFQPFAEQHVIADGQVTTRVGAGVAGSIGGEQYRLGTGVFAAELAGSEAPGPDGLYLACRGRWLARFDTHDTLRADAIETIAGLQDAGIRVVIASGDAHGAVARTAAQLGIDEWSARQSPSDKIATLRSLREAGRPVLMLGDGINDAPVLSGADASIAIGDGTALARASADAVLLGQNLAPLLALTSLAARTRRIVRTGLAWAAAYNLTGIGLAATGFLTPWMAAIGMSASSLLVVLHALRAGRPVAHHTPHHPAAPLTRSAST